MDGLRLLACKKRAADFVSCARDSSLGFALVLSYTETCQIPGITVAGASPELARHTPAADAELIEYGRCRCISGIPATPDGKPTPALISRAALQGARIPHRIINAGSPVEPQLEHIRTGLRPGRSIADGPAMTKIEALAAVGHGKDIAGSLFQQNKCLVIGESTPGGTTTALALLRGMGIGARVSSSMPENPSALKEEVAMQAVRRLDSREPLDVAAQLGDPMMLVVAGMISAVPEGCLAMLAGGTQMAAVLAAAQSVGICEERIAVATTSYVADDPSADMALAVSQAADVPVLAADPGLGGSSIAGLRAYSEGFAKEGAGAGGCVASAMIREGITPAQMRALVEGQYRLALPDCN